MIKRLTNLSLIFFSIGLVCTLANVPAAVGIENPSAYMLAQLKNSDEASQEIRSAGKLILGPDLEIYIIFSKGEKIAEPIRGFISGIPRDLTQEEAEANVIQFATLEAWNTWLRCLEAKDKAQKKEMKQEQADLTCANASEKAAILAKVTALAMLENPFADPEEWEEQLSRAEQELAASQIAKRNAIALGATLDEGTAEGFTPLPLIGSEGDSLTAVPTETTWNRQQVEQPTTSPSGFTQ